MAITKTAERFEKLASQGAGGFFDKKIVRFMDKLIRPLHDKTYDYSEDTRLLKGIRRTGRGIGAISKGTYELGRKGLIGGVKGIGSYGRFVARKPSIGIPLTAMAAYAPYKAKDSFQKNFYHTDPNINHTYKGPWGLSYYNKPMMEQRNQHQNFIY